MLSMMTDRQLLEWIAEHVSLFEPSMTFARMAFIDKDGVEHTVKFHDESGNNNPSSLYLMKGCIEEALKLDPLVLPPESDNKVTVEFTD